MARSTMSGLIQTVRSLTMAGPSEFAVGTANYFDDNQIEAILDRHRAEVDRFYLTPIPSYVSGSVQYKEYRADKLGYFESTNAGTSGFVVQTSTGSAAGTASYSVDYVRGIVSFTSDQAGTAFYITGRVYDVYGAAADLLNTWAAKEARSFDFASDGQDFKRSQKAKMLRESAQDMSAQAWVRTGSLVRSDA